jgi:pyruvate dehydrogenase E2 component (dihydrolipoamide acetyltransferase)
MAWLQDENFRRPVTERLMYSAVLLKAVARAVPSVPEMNGHYLDGEFHRFDAVHLGVAISLRDGSLVAPAIQDAETCSVDDIMRTLRDLVMRARAGKLRASEMANATITVTNLGDRGVEVVHGIIYAPQVALVGFGKVVERPWAENGMLGVRPTVTATLAADHRVSNGHRGGIFLSTLDQLLQEPEKL